MSTVTLLKSGFIFRDTFNNVEADTNWEISVDDATRYSFNQEVLGSLVLKSGTEPIIAFLKDLGSINNFVLTANLAYTPQKTNDESGIKVQGDSFSSLELGQSLPTSSVKPWIRVVRNGNVYQGYNSTDGKSWTSWGSVTFSFSNPKIGLYLQSDASSTASLNLKEVTITTGTDVVVKNLTQGVVVKLLNSSGTVMQTKTCQVGSSEVKFDISALSNPFVGNFSVTLSGSTEYKPNTSANITIWQGDSYSFQIAPDLYFYDEGNVKTLVQEGIEKLLGYHNTGSQPYRDFKMVARNNFTSGTLKSVNISTMDYNGTSQYSTLVKLALDNAGSPSTFSNTVNLGNIGLNSEKVFWLRVNKDTDYSSLVNDIYFGLGVSASFT